MKARNEYVFQTPGCESLRTPAGRRLSVPEVTLRLLYLFSVSLVLVFALSGCGGAPGGAGGGGSDDEAEIPQAKKYEFKLGEEEDLAEAVIEGLRPVQSRYRELTADPTYIDSLLAEGAAKIRPIAEKTLAAVKDRVGLG